jgi:soluble lytic murein transglycosylase-like protein
VFATQPKPTALAVLVAAVAAGALGGVTAAAQPAGPEPAKAPTFAPLAKAAARLEAISHHGAGSSRTAAPASPESLGVSKATLESIARCESGGDPTAVSADGTYRGLYQFDEGTWQSVGGNGDPAAASPGEQTMRAALLYARAGSSPWPVCGS